MVGDQGHSIQLHYKGPVGAAVVYLLMVCKRAPLSMHV